MHVVFVTPYFSPKVGGLENYSLQIARGLVNKYGWKVSIITSNHLSNEQRVDEIYGMAVHRLKTGFKISNTPVGMSWPKDIEAILRELKPDLVNAHTPVPYISDIAVQVANKLGIPSILTYQNDIFKENIFLKLIGMIYYQTLGKNTFQSVQKIIVSSVHYAAISPYLKPYLNKIEVIPPGILTTKLIVHKPTTTLNTVLFIAQLDKTHRHKGLNYLIEALSLVTQNHPEITLSVIGKGDDEKSYAQLAKTLGIESQVSFKGYVPDSEMPKLLSNALCLCLPSVSQAEGFGMVILEAATQKTPAVGSNIGGIPAVIEDGETGVLVPAANSRALAEAICRLYENPNLRTNLGESAYTRVYKEFTWDIQIKKTRELFEKIAFT